ncbi:uncharacterized protein LOC132696689 [Cylas formicarius]|uniref:uncharacterized protein LOC132696689 n=1 Tax=Cylas formicarius TaxID=197179 RepID=UPI00295884CE|nr:uncharacterized protein LOC132696689 [Cylas formicarius]
MLQEKKTIILRRGRISQKIKNNLQPLLQNTKKQIAQDAYYQNNPIGSSPLIGQNQKTTVHERLGLKQIRMKRIPFIGTNSSTIPPKKRIFKQHPNHIRNFNNSKFQRIYSAQARLDRIRQKHKPLRLHRFQNTRKHRAANLTVQVKNPNYVGSGIQNRGAASSAVGRFKMILNPVLQSEILHLKNNETKMGDVIIYNWRPTPVTTIFSTHERFSNY